MQFLHDLFGTFLVCLSICLGSGRANLGSAASSSSAFGPFLGLFTLLFVSLLGRGCGVGIFSTQIALRKIGFRKDSFVHRAGKWPRTGYA